MISKFFRTCTPECGVSARRRVPSCPVKLFVCRDPASRGILYFELFFFFLISIIALSCNQPFQPEIQYTPKLNVYSVLFANSNAVYVRVMPVVESPSGVSQPITGATVTLAGAGPNGTVQFDTLSDTTEVIDGDTVSFYYSPAHIIPGGTYFVAVNKDGFPPAYAYATVPFAYATIPDQGTDSILRSPNSPYVVSSEINFQMNLSNFASAAFAQMLVEYRGIDSTGNFHIGYSSVFPIDSLDPFIEVESTVLPLSVSTDQYRSAFIDDSLFAAIHLKNYHMYVDIIVTQVDNNLYRYFITSTRMLDPLSMRTDKIIFTNIFNNAGTGIVAGASVDTTRIFLF